jgi:hypothetical protein
MSENKKPWGAWSRSEPASGANAGQRRLSRVVHDERGNARIEWIEESAGRLLDGRVPLEILDDGPAARGAGAFQPHKIEKGWNPYQPVAQHKSEPERRGTGTTTRTDLRKLSEWIKLKKEMEERKLRGEDED